MLRTHLEHITTDEEYQQTLAENENVMICCGRMGPMCLPVYDAMEQLREDYPQVKFKDLWFDGPASTNIRRLPEVRSFRGLPFTIYYKNGEVVAATSSLQSHDQITAILDKEFGQ